MQATLCGFIRLDDTGLTPIYSVLDTGDAIIASDTLGCVIISELTLNGNITSVTELAITRICETMQCQGAIVDGDHVITLNDGFGRVYSISEQLKVLNEFNYCLDTEFDEDDLEYI